MLIDELLDGAASCVHPEVRLAVGREALIIKLFHLQPIRGQRPAAVERDALEDRGERHIQPDDRAVAQHQLAVGRRRRRCRRRWRRPCRARAAGRSAPRARGRGSRARRPAGRWSGCRGARARSMRSSMSSTFQSRRLPSARATRRLAGAHEADQVDLVGLHAASPARAARADRDRRRTRGRTRPPRRRRRSCVGPRRAERGDRKGHRQPMIVPARARCRR